MQGFMLTAIFAAEKCILFIDNVNFDSHLSVKCRSRSPGHDACLKSVSRTITIQGFIFPAIIATEKSTYT